MSWSPHVTVAAVIEQNGRFLVVEEAPDGVAVLNQPAGHVEFGESMTDAVCREVLEETAREFTPQDLVGIYQWTLPGTERTYLRFCFRGTVGEPLPDVRLDPDITATHWLDRAQIADGPLPPRSPLVLRCIDDAGSSRTVDLGLLHVLA